MVCQVRNTLKTDKLSKVRIEYLKMQIMQLHVEVSKLKHEKLALQRRRF